jgi:hypothetical protein
MPVRCSDRSGEASANPQGPTRPYNARTVAPMRDFRKVLATQQRLPNALPGTLRGSVSARVKSAACL